MGQQGVERREMLRILAAASVASRFPGFRRWAFACDHEAQQSGTVKQDRGPYQPQFFSAEEYATVERLTELIIPNDGQLGAREAGVSEFVDFMVANSVAVGMHSYQPPSRKRPVNEQSRVPDVLKSRQSLQYLFRYGLNWLEALNVKAVSLANNHAMDLGEESFEAMVSTLRDAGITVLRQGAVADLGPFRLEQLGFKGLQVFWPEMPECPHKNDPEHQHLPPPIY